VAFEIERKFLVANDDWRGLATRTLHIRQAYLASSDKASIRVRIVDDSKATLTIKSRGADLKRLELTYDIPVLEAEALLALRQGSLIDKHRSVVPHGGLNWEIDQFNGENAGLVVAEIELHSETQSVALPAWIGREVTGHRRYYNSALSQQPYPTWTRDSDVA